VQDFTVAEANRLLPRLVPIVEQLMPAWQRLREARPAVAAVVDARPHGDLGGGVMARAAADTIAVQDALDAIQALGVVVRDPAVGLLDFPAERHGERVYLCWRYPEPRVAHWHSIHGGFAGRQPLDADVNTDTDGDEG
jgi:hypothetical protein